jgi:trimeric autotransporter adhesin
MKASYLHSLIHRALNIAPLARPRRLRSLLGRTSLVFSFFALFTGATVSAQGLVTLDSLDAQVTGSHVSAVAVQPDGKTIIGGSFDSVLGVPRSNLARLNADGTLDLGFDFIADGEVFSLVVQSDGGILVAGSFASLQPRGAARTMSGSRIARIKPDGNLDLGFKPNPSGVVYCVAVQPNGKILIGGSFTNLQPNTATTATTRNRIARLNVDGGLDPTFNPNANKTVWCIALQPDGRILVGGQFTMLQPNGASTPILRSRIARFEPDGSLDQAFDPRADASVYCMGIQPGGRILVGGNFTTFQPNGSANQTTRNYVARLNADGTLDPGFNPDANGSIETLALQTDGKILLGGLFTTLHASWSTIPVSRPGFARVGTTGDPEFGFAPVLNEAHLSGSAVQADGKMLLVGGFQTIQPNLPTGPVSRKLFARLNNGPASQSLSIQDTSRVVWQREGTSPEVEQVTFELSTDGGITWTSLGSGARAGASAKWEIHGLALPDTGKIRARGRTFGGYDNASSGLMESVAAFPTVDLGRIERNGDNLTLSGLNGVSGTTNYVLMSTNATLPRLQWTRIATNVLNLGGDFAITLTNEVDYSASERFFLIQSPK